MRVFYFFSFLGGAIHVEGFQARQMEFENFERKFEVFSCWQCFLNILTLQVLAVIAQLSIYIIATMTVFLALFPSGVHFKVSNTNQV